MSRIKNLGIQNSFRVFIGTVAISGIAIILLFVLSVREIQRVNSFNEQISQLSIEQQKMRESEQSFLLHYNEDQGFYKSGNNRYLRSHEEASKKLLKF